MLLSATYEVWGGDTDFTPLPEHWNYYYSIDQQDYTKLGEAASSHTFAGDFDYYVIVTRDQLMLDAVQGSDGTFCNGVWATGNVSGWENVAGPPDGQYAVMGSGSTGGTYSSYVVLTNPSGQWSNITVILDDGGVEGAPFEANLTRIRYQDSAGREIDYDFSSGTMNPVGALPIPGPAVLAQPAGEAGTTYLWEPVYGTPTNRLDTVRGVLTTSVPQPGLVVPPIPTAAITVDGAVSDWDEVDPYLVDANTAGDNVSLTGTDLEYLKLAYSPDGTRLNVLAKVADAISQGVWYRLFFDQEDADYPVAAPGNYQVGLQYLSGIGWCVVSQGWNSENPDDWYPIAANGHAAASGAYLEGSFDVAALGLGAEFFVFGHTMTASPYVMYDQFHPQAEPNQDGGVALGAWGEVVPAGEDWTFEVTFDGFVNANQTQTYYDCSVGAGRFEPAISPSITATWFTGTYQNTYYDHALVLGASIRDDMTDVEWEADGLFLFGHDPLTMTLGLKSEVQGGVAFTASYSIDGGPWQVLWQHTISDGHMPGFADLFPYVGLETGFVPGPTEVDVVRQIDYEVPGPADDSYEYEVSVGGYYLTDLEVTTPWGEVFQASDYLPPDWLGEDVGYEGGRLSFEAYTESDRRQFDLGWEGLLPGEWAALDTGQTLLSVTSGGEDRFGWTGVVNFAGVTQPTQVPTLVDPVHGQTGVPLRPEIRWEPWAAPGAESGIWIDLQDDARTGPDYENFLSAGLDAWQVPLPLDPATLYQVELDFVNRAVATVSGLGVNVMAMTESDPRFTTIGPGVTDVRLERGLEYDYPDAIGPTRDYEVMLTGIGLTGFSLAAPWGETFDLGDYYSPGWPVAEYFYDDGRIHIEAETNEDGECWIEVDWILTEAEWAALDTGDTTLLATYDGGPWGGVFDFTGLPVPDEAAHITSPGHGATGVGFYPVFAWDPWALPGPNPVVGIEFDECGDPESEAIEDHMGPDGTTWTVPDPLRPGAAYQFGVRFSNTGVVSTGGVDVQVAGYTDSDILFTTAAAGVADVRLLCGTDYMVPGTARDDGLALFVQLQGYGLTGAEIVLPWGQTVDTADLLPPGWDGSEDVEIRRGALEFEAYRDDGMECLGFWWNLSDNQWAALIAGQVGVTVDYTGGTWSQPLGFAGIDLVGQEPAPTAPVHRKVEAGPVVAEWAPWASPGPDAVIEVDVWDEWGLVSQELDQGEELPASATSWVLPDLPDPAAVYAFSLSFFNRVTGTVGGARVARETGTGSRVTFVSGASIPADDHGNTSAEATPVPAPVSLAAPTVVTGTLGYAGDIDFFRFEAVAGQTYEIRVSLPEGGLEDSTLWLYGSDGRTLLAWDDDSGPNCGSYLVCKAWDDHTWYLAVDAYALDESLGEYTLSIALSEKTSDPPAVVMSNPLQWLFAGAGVGAGFSTTTTGAASRDAGVVLHRLDLSDPFAPASEVGAHYLADPAGVALSDDAQRVYYGDDTNAWEWFGASELVAVDLGAYGDPVEVWRVATQEREVESVAVAGHYLYAGTQPDDETIAYLEVYDLSDPATAVFVGQSPALVAPGGDPFDSFNPGAIAVSGHRVYILHYGQPTISILDVSDPAAPVLLGQCVVPGAARDSIRSMAARGNTLVLGLDGEVWFIDVSDPAAPGVPLAVPVPGGTVPQILVCGPLVFVGCSQAGVTVFDLTDPALPVLVADYQYVGASGSVAVAGGAVYVPTSRGETAVFVDETPQTVWWTGDDSESWQNGDNWSSLAVPQRWTTPVFEGLPGYQPVLYADEAVWGVDIRTAGLTVTCGQSGLAVGEGGMRIAGGASPTSTIDLGAGHLVLDYAEGDAGPLADVAAWVRAGLNATSGYWDGDGITSSAAAAQADGLTAVGVLDNTDPEVGGKTEFAGQAVDATSVLVTYTWWGDANLDGVVDANDYDVIDKNFLFNRNPSSPWFTGDFTYDGVIDANDYDKIDRAFLFQTGPLAPAAAAPLGQAMPATDQSDDVDLLALAVASGTVVRPLGAGEEPGAATAPPIAAAAVAIPETEASTLSRIEPQAGAGTRPDADLFVWEEGTSPDRAGALPHDLADDLVDVLELVDLGVPLGV